MKYYILTKDKEYTDVPKIINWYGKINTEHIIKKEYNKLQKMYGLLLQENGQMYDADGIFEPVFLVSKMIKYCMEKYEPNMQTTFVGLLERKNNKVYEYFLPHLVEQDCLSEKSIITCNGTILQKAVFSRKKIDKNKYIFQIGGLNTVYIAAREEFVESILKRGAKGIGLIEVEIEE